MASPKAKKLDPFIVNDLIYDFVDGGVGSYKHLASITALRQRTTGFTVDGKLVAIRIEQNTSFPVFLVTSNKASPYAKDIVGILRKYMKSYAFIKDTDLQSIWNG